MFLFEEYLGTHVHPATLPINNRCQRRLPLSMRVKHASKFAHNHQLGNQMSTLLPKSCPPHKSIGLGKTLLPSTWRWRRSLWRTLAKATATLKLHPSGGCSQLAWGWAKRCLRRAPKRAASYPKQKNLAHMDLPLIVTKNSWLICWLCTTPSDFCRTCRTCVELVVELVVNNCRTCRTCCLERKYSSIFF